MGDEIFLEWLTPFLGSFLLLTLAFMGEIGDMGDIGEPPLLGLRYLLDELTLDDFLAKTSFLIWYFD